MPRTSRASRGGFVYHVLNRGNGRSDVFHKDDDFAAFVNLTLVKRLESLGYEVTLAERKAA